MNRDNNGSVATYVIIALILAVITYIEFAIVEYEIAWLTRNAVMFWLILLSVIKFLLVVMFFMHLKGDDKIYSGFFTSGMIMAMGTFIGLAFLFTVTSVSNYTFTNKTPEATEEVQTVGSPPPVDQSQPVTAPLADDQDTFAVGEEGTVQVAVAAFDTAAAEAAYVANCASCHQASGTGLPGAFPPMAGGHAAVLHNADGGREYLMHAVVFGVQGAIEVDGTTYNGAMPAWNFLDDATLAGTLNHITNAWGNDAFLADFEPFTADEIAGVRGAGLNPTDVHAERVSLVLGEASAAPVEEAAPEAAEPAAEAEAEAEEPAEEAVAAEETTDAAPVAAGGIDLAAGEVVFQSHCFACHQATGQGIPMVFPPLAGNAAELYNAEGGREYLLHAVMYGVAGELEVQGVTYEGSMPGWTQLDDDEIADVLNYVTHAWDNEAALDGFEPYTAEEVSAERGLTLTAEQVLASRPDPSAAPAAPAEEEEDAAEATEAAEEPAAVAAAGADFDRGAAEAAYMASCSSCHNATGAGIPQVFPPLAGHANDVYNADGGREYLIHVLLYGLTGQITVDGISYSSAMPAWANLGDDALANVYNHIVTAWGNEDSVAGFEPMTADEIAAQRGLNLSTADVYAERQALGLD